MPSHAFGPRVHAAQSPIVGLNHSRCLIAVASLNNVITVMTAINRVNQNNVILWFQIIESETMKVLSCCLKHRRVWWAYRGYRTIRAVTTVSWRTPGYLCSNVLAKTGLTFNTTSIIVEIMIAMIERTAVLLRTAP